MRYQILTFLCAMAAVAYVQRAALSVPVLEVARDLGISDDSRVTVMGWVQSLWYLGYALLQMPAGWLVDRFGSRLTLAWLCVLWSMLTLATGFSVGIFSLAVVWFLMGAAQAGAFPCAAKAIGQVFPESERARAAGILAGGMLLGGAIAPGVAGKTLSLLDGPAASLEVFRWKLLLGLLAIPGIVWSIMFLMFVRPASLPSGRSEAKADQAASDRPERTRNNPGASSRVWRRLFSSPSLALLCAQQFFRAAAMVFFLTWFPSFLQETRNVSVKGSGLLTTYAGIGGVVGSLLGGAVSDCLLAVTRNKRLSRQGIAVAGMASCAVLITISGFVRSTEVSIAIVALGVFCAAFGGVSGYTVAIEFGGKQAGMVFSAMNMCGNIGAMLFPVTASWLVRQTGNWNQILYFFAVIMALDAVCWAFLNPKEPLFT